MSDTRLVGTIGRFGLESSSDGTAMLAAEVITDDGQAARVWLTFDADAVRSLKHLAAQLAKKAMDAAMAEEQYFAKCHALGGISVDDARKILDDTLAWAERRGLSADAVWPRAWELAIEKSMQPEA